MNPNIEEIMKQEQLEKKRLRKKTQKKSKIGFISSEILEHFGKGDLGRRIYGIGDPFYKKNNLPKNLINDKEVVMKALEVDEKYFNGISDRLKDDEDVGEKMINISPHYFQFLSDKLRDNKKLAMKAVKDDNNLYNFISDRLKIDIDVLKLIDFKFFSNCADSTYDKEFTFKKKIDRPAFLKLFNYFKNKYKTLPVNLLLNAPDDVKNDKALVIKIIKLSKCSYRNAPLHLQKDPDVIDAFMKNKDFDRRDISTIIDFNKETALQLVKIHPWLYSHSIFMSDKDVILQAMKKKGYIHRSILPYIPKSMKEDKDIKAVLNSKSAEHFSKKYNDDKSLILKSVKKYNKFEFASERLKKDKSVVMAALTNPARKKHNPTNLLQFTTDKLRSDKDVVLQALENRLACKKILLKDKFVGSRKKCKKCKGCISL
jgi:hypothetical protein